MLEPVHRLCAARVAGATALALVVGACTALTDLDYLGRGGEDGASSGSGGIAQGGEGGRTSGGGCDTSPDCTGSTGGTGGSGVEGGAAGAAPTGGGGSGGTPDTSVCFGCGQQSCSSRGIDCIGNSVCSDWLNCMETCADVECTYACDDMYSSAHQLYEALYGCLCMYCLDECALADPCAHGN